MAAVEFGAGFVGCEHPFDAFPRFISLLLPYSDLFAEPFGLVDAAAETLALQHADLALEHIEPTGVFRSIVEFEAAQDAAGLGAHKCLIQRDGVMDRQVVLPDTEAGGSGVMDVDEL